MNCDHESRQGSSERRYGWGGSMMYLLHSFKLQVIDTKEANSISRILRLAKLG